MMQHVKFQLIPFTTFCFITICNKFWYYLQHFAAYHYFFIGIHFQNCSEAPKIQNIKFQPNTLPILQIDDNTPSFSKLLQNFLLLQMHEIWYGGQRYTNNATCKVSTHSIYLFLFYNNMQQNPVQI